MVCCARLRLTIISIQVKIVLYDRWRMVTEPGCVVQNKNKVWRLYCGNLICAGGAVNQLATGSERRLTLQLRFRAS